MSDSLILVTGASGFLGGHVVRQLLEDGYKVRGQVRDLKDEKRINVLRNLCPEAKHPLELVEGELTNPDCWPDIVKDCEYVHHIASPMPLQGPKNPEEEIVKPTLEGNLNVLKACKEAKTVKRVILTSTLFAVACKGDNETPYTEKDWLDDKLSGLPHYPRNKILQERAAWDFVDKLAEDEKFELVVLNPGFLMGPFLLPHLCNSGNLLLRFLDGRMPMVPKFNFNLCDVRDCAKTHVKCMTMDGVAGHRHILTAGPMWLKDFGEVLTEELEGQGYKIPTKEIPNIFMAMASKLDKDITNVRFIASSALNVDNSRQKDVIQLETTPKEQTLIDMVHSMIELGIAKKTDGYKGRKTE